MITGWHICTCPDKDMFDKAGLRPPDWIRAYFRDVEGILAPHATRISTRHPECKVMIVGRAMIMPLYEDGPTMNAYMSLGGIFGEGHHDLSLDVSTYMGQTRIVGQADVIWGGDVIGKDIGGCELDWESVGSFDEEQAKTVLRLLPIFVAKFEEAARRGECASDCEAEGDTDV